MKRRFVLLLFLPLLLSCSGGYGANQPGDNNTGTYNLTTVNTSALPVVTLQTSDLKAEITGGTLTLRSDGTYSETRQSKITPTAGAPSNVNGGSEGIYTISGSSITFTIPKSATVPQAITFSGVVGGGILGYTFSGTAFGYTR